MDQRRDATDVGGMGDTSNMRSNITPQYMRVLADDVQHTVDNGYEFAPENVVAALRAAADQLERVERVAAANSLLRMEAAARAVEAESGND